MRLISLLVSTVVSRVNDASISSDPSCSKSPPIPSIPDTCKSSDVESAASSACNRPGAFRRRQRSSASRCSCRETSDLPPAMSRKVSAIVRTSGTSLSLVPDVSGVSGDAGGVGASRKTLGSPGSWLAPDLARPGALDLPAVRPCGICRVLLKSGEVASDIGGLLSEGCVGDPVRPGDVGLISEFMPAVLVPGRSAAGRRADVCPVFPVAAGVTEAV